MKFAAFLPALALMVGPAFSQVTAPTPSPQASPSAVTLPSQAPSPTLAAGAMKNTDVIEEGETEENVSRIGRNVIIRGTVNGSVSVVSGQCFVMGKVNGPVSVVNGSVGIIGRVNGPVSVVAGDIRVAGVVTGNCSAVGGRVIKSPGAKVGGETVELGSDGLAGALVKKIAGFNAGNQFHHRSHPGYCPVSSLAGCSHFFVIWRLLAGICLIFISLLLALIWPEHFAQTAGELGASPLKYFAVGFLFWVAFWVLLAIALLTSIILIGIPFLGALILLNLAIKWYGYTVLFTWIGHLIVRKLCKFEAAEIACVLTGGVVLVGLFSIPCLGFLLCFLAAKFAAGAAVFGAFRKRTIVIPDPQTP